MQEAIHYGKVELIPGIICDGYVLNDGTAVIILVILVPTLQRGNACMDAPASSRKMLIKLN